MGLRSHSRMAHAPPGLEWCSPHDRPARADFAHPQAPVLWPR